MSSCIAYVCVHHDHVSVSLSFPSLIIFLFTHRFHPRLQEILFTSGTSMTTVASMFCFLCVKYSETQTAVGGIITKV